MTRRKYGKRTTSLDIACVRCRTRKKRCDRASPICGECRRAGASCVRFEARRHREAAVVPIEYVR